MFCLAGIGEWLTRGSGLTREVAEVGGDYFGVKLNETIMGFYRFLLFYSCGEGGARTGYWQGLSELSMGIKCGACDASEESGYTGR